MLVRVLFVAALLGSAPLMPVAAAETDSPDSASAAVAPTRSTSTIVVIGDSLSAAHGIAPTEGWVALLDAKLKSEGKSIKVVNASISGETTAGGLARLPKILADEKPKLVVVELGANDGLRGLPIAEARANLHAMLEAVRAANAKALLLGIELPVNYGPQYRDGLRSMYRGLAAEFNVPLLPFLLDGVALDPALMQDDGLHPRAAGEPKVLDNVWTRLAPMLTALEAGAGRRGTP